MKRFNNLTNNQKITEAIDMAERLLRPDSKMAQDLIKKNDWKYDSGTGPDVVMELLKPRELVGVLTFRKLNPFSRVLGYQEENFIYLNVSYVTSASLSNLVGTLCHEYSHFCGFHHGNNFTSKDKNFYSVPFYLSQNIHLWI